MGNNNLFGVNSELLDYVKSAKEHGLADSEIKQNLLNAGWEAEDIENTFAHFVASLHMQKTAVETESSLLSPLMQSRNEAKAQTPTTQNFVEQGQVQPVKKSHLGLWLFIFIVLLLLGGAAFYVYTYGFYTPSQIWNKFTQVKKPDIMRTDFTFSYTDNTEPKQQEKSSFQASLKNLKLEFNGNYYINSADPKSPESTADVNYTFGSSGTSFSTGFKYKLKNQVLYLNVGSNPFLEMFSQGLMTQSGQTKKQEWLKLDLNEIKKLIAEDKTTAEAENAAQLKALTDPEFKSALENIWKEAKIVKMKKNLGNEKLGEVMTQHFEAQVDKSELKKVLTAYLNKFGNQFVSGEASVTASNDKENLELATYAISALIDKLEIKQFEVWIGKKDFELYQVKVWTNAPSFISLLNAISSKSFSSANLSGDQKRLSDMRQIATALQLYKNDMEGYPEAKDGKPLELTPTYITQIPEAPKAEGQCSEYYNTYWYTPKGQKKVVEGKTIYSGFEYTFCFGQSTGGYKPGIGKLTQNGIESGLPCNGGSELCKASNTPAPSKLEAGKIAIDEVISKIDFGAEISITSKYSEYGKILAIEEPKEFLDMISILNSARSQSRDAKRLADVRQIASALELYFNDSSEYPKNLSDITPTYIGLIPTAPLPADGTCQNSDNEYSYKRQDSLHYQLTFCLGENTGGYNSGKHLLTPAGIQ
jgi:hypothetical protein